MKLKLNTPLEVTETQRIFFAKNFDGYIAHRHDKETGKNYIKPLMFLGHKKLMEEALEKIK